MTIHPRHVLCVLGHWTDFSPVQSIVSSIDAGFTLDLEYSQLESDDRMEVAFKASLDRNHPTIRGQEWQEIKSHSAVAYILSPPIEKSEAESISATALLMVEALLKEGGVAAKSESAGLAHGRDHWLDLAKEYTKAIEVGDLHTASATLYSAWVQRAIHDEDSGAFYSVGMHLLGHRDVELDNDIDIDDAVDWIDLMGLYLVADKPKRELLDGEGFRLCHEGPRRIIELGDCMRYAEDDYGYIRLIDPV